MSKFNVYEVVKQAKEAPEYIDENLSRADFIDQELVNKNTQAIQAKGEGDCRPGVLDIYAYEHMKAVYDEHFHCGDAMGKVYLQWAAERKLCQQYGVPFDAPMPEANREPADVAFATAKLVYAKELMDKLAEMRRWTIKRRGLERIRRDRAAPSQCPRPAVVTKGETKVPGVAPITEKGEKTEESKQKEEKKKKMEEKETLSPMDIWRLCFGDSAPLPVALATPGYAPSGPFVIPFPLERNWFTCFASVRQNIQDFTTDAIEIRVGRKRDKRWLFIGLARYENTKSGRIQELLIETWHDFATWHKELIEDGKDIPVTAIMARHLAERMERHRRKNLSH